MKYLFLILILPGICLAEPFLSFGLGMHSDSDKPEITLSNPLGIIEVGYRFKRYKIKYTHISGLKDREKGYGFNMISIHYEITDAR